MILAAAPFRAFIGQVTQKRSFRVIHSEATFEVAMIPHSTSRAQSGIVITGFLRFEQPSALVFGRRFAIEYPNQSIHRALPCVTSVPTLEPICQNNCVHACTPKC